MAWREAADAVCDIAAETKNPHGPYLPRDVRRLIGLDPDPARYNVVSLHSFVMPWSTAVARGTVPHRFLLLGFGLDDKKLWLDLERRLEIALLYGFGSAIAKTR